MTPKEFAKKIIASINPGTADISGIGDGTIKGAISEQNKKIDDTFGVGNVKTELSKTLKTYTATENCYIYVFGNSTSNAHNYIDITLDSGYKTRSQIIGASGVGVHASCPIRKGQTATITIGSVTVNNIYVFTN